MNNRYETLSSVYNEHSGNLSIIEVDKAKGERYTFFMPPKIFETMHKKDKTIETRIEEIK